MILETRYREKPSSSRANSPPVSFLGAMDSLKAHGIDYDPDEYVVSRFSLEGAYESAMRFFEKHRDVTAVMTMSDMMAMGVTRALHEMGLRVPQDVSVSGFDGTVMARYYVPSIASVRQPTTEIAKRSVELLCDMLEGGQAQHVKVEYSLVEGESIGLVRVK